MAFAQVATEPVFPNTSSDITLFYDASAGNAALLDCGCDIYLHSGVITDQSADPTDWQFVRTEWGVANADWRLTPVSGQPGIYSINYNISDFYQLPQGTNVQQLAFVFRDATGSIVGRGPGGADIYYDVQASGGAFQVRLLSPIDNPVVAAGESIEVRAAASATSTFEIFEDDQLVNTSTGAEVNTTITANPGGHTVDIRIEDNTAGASQEVSFQYFATTSITAVDVPAGVEPGYTDLGNGNSAFYLYAPLKQQAILVTSASDFEFAGATQMAPVNNGTGFYAELPTPSQQPFIYQYVIDGITIADPFSELILDPANDRFIEDDVFADIPSSGAGTSISGPATWVRAKVPFNWEHDDYDRPEDEELVIYEMLIRDFTEDHSYQSLIDSMGYFETLGVNAIELMPVNEFEGNLSWGYNPSYHMALDKYYGPPEKFKEFVDLAHSKGIAVFVDVVFNHGFGQNPYVQLYGNERTAAPNGAGPFFNVTARHPFNVGQDANHESIHMQRYTGRILRYLIEEYHLDGFRFDLSKGFTQTDYGNDVGAWGRYDAGRIAILKGYRDSILNVDPLSHVMLEHFAEAREERELTSEGMFIWGNMNFNYSQAAMGYNNNSLFGVTPQSRGFDNPRLIGYMESHDEERVMFRIEEFGNGNADYSTKDYATGLARKELISNFFYTTPGSKMLWQFGEYGYPIDINFNGRTGNKPILWDLLDRPANRRLFDVTRSLIDLRSEYDVFAKGNHLLPGGLAEGLQKWLAIDGDDFDVLVAGNFDIQAGTVEATFPSAGTYFDYWTGEQLEVTGGTGTVNQNISLEPGEYRLYTSIALPEPPMGYLPAVSNVTSAPLGSEVTLFPQVVQTTAQLSISGWTANAYTLAIVNAQGQLLRQWTSADQVQALDLDRLAPGYYNLRIQDEEHRTTVVTFIKN